MGSHFPISCAWRSIIRTKDTTRNPAELAEKATFLPVSALVPASECFSPDKSTRFGKSGNAPNDFQVVEQGAHDGQLAEDILENLTSVKYTIIEPNPAYREAQNRRFDVGAIQHQVVAEDFSAKTGVFLCNELLDAFPVDRYRVQNGEWHEIRVVLDENGKFADQLAPNPSEIDPGKPAIDLPEGFEAEFCPGFECWLSGVFNLVEKGIFLLIDYGFSDSELFDPARSRGTLRCFRNHEATENPYEHLGETDLTAHVNFTRVMALAESTGFDILGFTDQNRFLTGIAADWLQEIEQENEGKPTASHLVRQFQTLTHPGSMGRNFRVLVLGKNAGSLTLDGLRFG